LSCDLVIDTGNVTQAIVSVSDEGLVLSSSSSLGSCKFRGESYVCKGLSINHPSHHTIEGVQADGEVIAWFHKPTGELMAMSTLFRISSAQTPSYSFFKQFVPYASTTNETTVQMKDWDLSSIVPPEASYYIYQGSSVVPPCVPCEWVVFKSMINMDQGDFAYLVRNVEAGSRPVQGVGEREIFFNDTNNIPGAMPHDNKFYLKLRPTGNTKVNPKLQVNHVDLKKNIKQSKEDKEEEAKNPTTVVGQIKHSYTKYVNKHGTASAVGIIMSVGFIIAGIYYGYQVSNTKPITFEFAESWGTNIRLTLLWIYTRLVEFLGWLYSFTFGIFGNMRAAAKEAMEKAAEKRKDEESKPDV
jgi:hypothetical protein